MNLRNGITVIIPTYNRVELLEKTLKSLCFQSMEKDHFEVIIVDDGSSDNTKSVVKNFQRTISVRYFYQQDKGFRVAKARNVGIFHARYKTCLFLDSGVIASSGLLLAHYKKHEYKLIALIGFAYGFEELEVSSIVDTQDFHSLKALNSLFSRYKNSHEFLDCRERVLQENHLSVDSMSVPWILFWTCHVSCATEILCDLGGFDEWFDSWGGEDVELAIRLHKAGIKFLQLDSERVIHCYHSREVKKNTLSMAVNAEYIYSKHGSDEICMLMQPETPWIDIDNFSRLNFSRISA